MEIPEKYDPKVSEPKWQAWWESEGIYAFDTDSQKEIYSIDTPPPTVSGNMHLGHAFSYTQQDVVARYKRMSGFNVFYPFGTDDNGLATERLVEKLNNVKGSRMDRSEFIKLCEKTLEKIRPDFVADWKKIGISADFTLFYSTINDHCRAVSQASFLQLYNKARAYRKFAPVIVCPLCQTAIAQVEMEDLEREGTLNHITVPVDGSETLTFATTRPELAPACVAITVHPDDERYKHLVGKQATLPALDITVPILADDLTKMEFGTGVVYWCPYGGIHDVFFVAKHPDLEVKHILSVNGKLNEQAGKYAGMTVLEAREAILSDWKNAGCLVKQEKIKQTVNIHERCGTPVEFIAMNQWFIRYLDLKENFLDAGAQLNWYPAHMRNRLDNWIKGLQWDWCISRQRFFGVSFPVWYCKSCDEPVVASEASLPVDPLKDNPPVSTCQKCGCSEFIPEKDVMDTWATSSLTPQIACALVPEMYDKLYPMSLRPQAHDIISFWLFNTMVKSQMHNGVNPWKDVIISGWALDPHGKKMSKSKGNVIEPQVMITKYSADALRFWAAGSKLGDDMPFQEKDLVSGQKLVTKLWNASRFVLQHIPDEGVSKPQYFNPVDQWILSKLQQVIRECTASFEQYEYSKAKVNAEVFFWHSFCDNYLEIIKDRLYNPADYDEDEIVSARYTLSTVLLNLLKLLSPVVPYICEEIYQLSFRKTQGSKSIHKSLWPAFDTTLEHEKADNAGDLLVDILALVRRHKNANSKSLKEPVEELIIHCDDKHKKLVEWVLKDLQTVTKAKAIIFGNLADGAKQCEHFPEVLVAVQL